MQKGDQVFAVFDSKFRFDIISPDIFQDDIEAAIEEDDVQKIAKMADIFKMHTYKDALNASSAIILYPGTKDMFYIKENIKQETDLEQILTRIFYMEEGIGYLSLFPH